MGPEGEHTISSTAIKTKNNVDEICLSRRVNSKGRGIRPKEGKKRTRRDS